MNNKTKAITIGTIILSALLIFNAGLYLFKAKSKSGLTLEDGVTSVIVVILAILSVASIFIIRKIRTRKDTILSAPYKEAIDDVMISVSASNMSSYSKKQIREDLLDLFSQASLDKKPLEESIVTDKEKFAADIIEAHGAKNGFITYVLSGLQYFVIYMFCIQGIEYLKNISNGAEFYSTNVDISTILLFSMLAFIALPLSMYVRDISFRKSKTSLLITGFIVIPIITFVIFIGFLELIENNIINAKWADVIVSDSMIVFQNIDAILFGIFLFVLGLGAKKIIQRKKLRAFLYR